MFRKGVVTGLVLALTVTMALAGSDLWIHVKVDDEGRNGDKVRVNIPMSLVKEVLPLIRHDGLRDGKIRLSELGHEIGDLDVEGLEDLDVRALWDAIRKLEDAEFVTVEGDDENVRVYKEGNFMLVEVDGGRDRVNIRVPLEVVGALFSGEPGELDLLAAIDALGNYTDGDLVHVQDGDSTVRIWIDNRNESD